MLNEYSGEAIFNFSYGVPVSALFFSLLLLFSSFFFFRSAVSSIHWKTLACLFNSISDDRQLNIQMSLSFSLLLVPYVYEQPCVHEHCTIVHCTLNSYRFSIPLSLFLSWHLDMAVAVACCWCDYSLKFTLSAIRGILSDLCMCVVVAAARVCRCQTSNTKFNQTIHTNTHTAQNISMCVLLCLLVLVSRL